MYGIPLTLTVLIASGNLGGMATGGDGGGCEAPREDATASAAVKRVGVQPIVKKPAPKPATTCRRLPNGDIEVMKNGLLTRHDRLFCSGSRIRERRCTRSGFSSRTVASCEHGCDRETVECSSRSIELIYERDGGRNDVVTVYEQGPHARPLGDPLNACARDGEGYRCTVPEGGHLRVSFFGPRFQFDYGDREAMVPFVVVDGPLGCIQQEFQDNPGDPDPRFVGRYWYDCQTEVLDEDARISIRFEQRCLNPSCAAESPDPLPCTDRPAAFPINTRYIYSTQVDLQRHRDLVVEENYVCERRELVDEHGAVVFELTHGDQGWTVTRDGAALQIEQESRMNDGVAFLIDPASALHPNFDRPQLSPDDEAFFYRGIVLRLNYDDGSLSYSESKFYPVYPRSCSEPGQPQIERDTLRGRSGARCALPQ